MPRLCQEISETCQGVNHVWEFPCSLPACLNKKAVPACFSESRTRLARSLVILKGYGDIHSSLSTKQGGIRTYRLRKGTLNFLATRTLMTFLYRTIPRLGQAVHDGFCLPSGLGFVAREVVGKRLRCWFEASGMIFACPYFCTWRLQQPGLAYGISSKCGCPCCNGYSVFLSFVSPPPRLLFLRELFSSLCVRPLIHF